MKSDPMTPPKDSPESQATERWEEMAIDFFWHFQHHTEMEFKHHLAQAFAQVAAETLEAAARQAETFSTRGVSDLAIKYRIAEAIREMKSPKKESKL